MDLELGLIVITALRLLVPLSIFRWPLAGGIAALLLDSVDTQIASFFGGSIPVYILGDKYFDMYYLTIELLVSRRWYNEFAKKSAAVLYLWRLVGLIIFQFTGSEKWLVLTPNYFEMFFLFFSFLQLRGIETAKSFWITGYQKLILILLVFSLVKIPQEILLHYWKEPLRNLYSWWYEVY